jgi:hypothetical protein
MGAGALHHQWTATAATATPAQGVAAAVVVWTVEGVLVELLAAQSIEVSFWRGILVSFCLGCFILNSS